MTANEEYKLKALLHEAEQKLKYLEENNRRMRLSPVKFQYRQKHEMAQTEQTDNKDKIINELLEQNKVLTEQIKQLTHIAEIIGNDITSTDTPQEFSFENTVPLTIVERDFCFS